MSLTLPVANRRLASIHAAAAKWNVPIWILWGVYGIETSFGADISTSSAGAMGAFQFIPSTARQYNYPMTNNPSDIEFAAQADSAAHYLSDLRKQYGNWNSAITHYSGGGYDLTKVRHIGSGGPLIAAPNSVNLHGGTDNQSGGIGGGIGGISGVGGIGDTIGAISSVGDFLGYITSSHFAFLILGGVLLVVSVVEVGKGFR